MTLALLAGYLWLGVAGVLWLWTADVRGGPERHAMPHALFLGFVMSMVFAPASMILSAVLELEVVWHASAMRRSRWCTARLRDGCSGISAVGPPPCGGWGC